MIWSRWFPPKAENYRNVLVQGGRFRALGEVSDTELDRIKGELRNISAKRPLDITDIRRSVRYSMLCEMLPEPIRKYRKTVHELISEYDSKNFGHYEDQIKLDGFPGAAMGFTVGLTRDLPRGIISDTLKLVLDPLGSLLELMDALDQNNPNNYVHQLERSWQSGDTFSRSRIVGNVTGQVALAFTPEIVKKFAKIPTELGEARAVKVEPGAAGIAEEAGTVAREAEVASRVGKRSVAKPAVSTERPTLKPNLQLFAEKEPMTRVGRWMCREEYEKMIQTGRVQMSPNGKTTYVANPSDINAFGKQAKPGSIYVEFDVSSNSIYPGGNKNWGQISGPGSYWDRMNQYRGLPSITEMPKAFNIKIKGEK